MPQNEYNGLVTRIQWSRLRSAPAVGALALYLALFSLALPLPPTVFVAFVALAFGISMSSEREPVAAPDALLPWLLLSFLVITLVSALLAQDQWRSIVTSVSLLPAGLVWYLIATRVPAFLLVLLPRVVALTGGVAAAYLLAVAVLNQGVSPQGWLDIAGYRHFGVPNDLLFLSVITPFALALLRPIEGLAVRLGTTVVLLAIGACLVVYQSRTAFLLFAAMSLFHLIARRPRVFLPVVGVAFLLFFALEMLSGFQMTAKLSTLSTVSSRVPLWMAAWQMFLDAPLFGQGPGGFSLLYESYLASLDVPAWVVLDVRHMPWAHNLYLETLAERGLLGGLSMSAIIIFILWKIKYLLLEVGTSGGLAKAAFYSFLVLLLAGLVDLSLLRLWLLVAIAIQLGLLSHHLRQPSAAPSHRSEGIYQ